MSRYENSIGILAWAMDSCESLPKLFERLMLLSKPMNGVIETTKNSS